MKPCFRTLFYLLTALIVPAFCQNGFSLASYQQYLETHQNLSTEALLTEFQTSSIYYKGTQAAFSTKEYAYLDSVAYLYSLTPTELELLKENHFCVSERLSFPTFGTAFHDIYAKDLPVLLTTDAVLHALHASYDQILMAVEVAVLKPQLENFLKALSASFPVLRARHENETALRQSLADVDLYVTMARSLLLEEKLQPQYVDPSALNAVWTAVQAEQFIMMPLFSEHLRNLDFSQFVVRGHYTREIWDPATGTMRPLLAPYFKSMMWLGRIDFLLTPPYDEPPWTREDIRRMNLGAALLDELIETSQARSSLDAIDEFLKALIGESDNLTPTEFHTIIQQRNISSAAQLLDDGVYDTYLGALISSQTGGQRILSDCFLMDPFSVSPDTLPISYRVSGQRFILDSYIFSNLVYDRIVYQGLKIWRPMPDPLDALFVLGNDNAAPLLQSELNQYHYGSQAAALRYLVDAYDADFWDQSLYNSWLQAIRTLNPPDDLSSYPFFMRTAAWQQEKLNTQLASWAELRHDNLLYAKQSYTGMTSCSYPHSFIEPYPEFYRQIGRFAHRARLIFAGVTGLSFEFPRPIASYFSSLETLMLRLEALAQKELAREPFNAEDADFLQRMLFIQGGSGAPPFSGWFSDLFYDPYKTVEQDYIVADVHTQPTDEFGTIVGRVLHVGVGEIQLGVFLTESPSASFKPMAFTGPVMSYYEKITDDFDRLTDERWKDMVTSDKMPSRPDWVNIYLADANGKAYAAGRELKSEIFNGIPDPPVAAPRHLYLSQNYPNPFNPSTTIVYQLAQTADVQLTLHDLRGRQVAVLFHGRQQSGDHQLTWQAADLPSGVYWCRLQAGDEIRTIKTVLVK